MSKQGIHKRSGGNKTFLKFKVIPVIYKSKPYVSPKKRLERAARIERQRNRKKGGTNDNDQRTKP